MAPTYLTDPQTPLIIDTSTAINLTASGIARYVLEALPNAVSVVEAVQDELAIGRGRGRPHADMLMSLADQGLVSLVTLNERASAIFNELVAGPAASTLGDGEAATLAYAAHINATPVIDERKARRICSDRFPHLVLASTCDIFAHGAVGKALGREKLAEGVLKALREARMRVLPERVGWVVDLIGVANALNCPSLSRAMRNSSLGSNAAPS